MTDHNVEIPTWTVRIPNVPEKQPTVLKGTKYQTIGVSQRMSTKSDNSSYPNALTRCCTGFGDLITPESDTLCCQTFTWIVFWNAICFIAVFEIIYQSSHQTLNLVNRIFITILAIACVMLLLFIIFRFYSNGSGKGGRLEQLRDKCRNNG